MTGALETSPECGEYSPASWAFLAREPVHLKLLLHFALETPFPSPSSIFSEGTPPLVREAAESHVQILVLQSEDSTMKGKPPGNREPKYPGNFQKTREIEPKMDWAEGPQQTIGCTSNSSLFVLGRRGGAVQKERAK